MANTVGFLPRDVTVIAQDERATMQAAPAVHF